MKIFTYAGIGSRSTPSHQIDEIIMLASKLSSEGWRLRSGGALGADSAFAGPVPHKQRTLYLPWRGFNGSRGDDCYILEGEEFDLCYSKAAQIHLAWNKCSPTTKKLHARNVAIILGPQLSTPVDAVICWTPKGGVTGGTGMGLRIAMRYGIPTFNLWNMNSKEVYSSLISIQQNYYNSLTNESEGTEVNDSNLKED